MKVLSTLSKLKDKHNLDVDLSYVNYTPSQLEQLNSHASTFKPKDTLEITRDTEFSKASRLLDLQKAEFKLPENPFMKTTAKPLDLQPKQWREFLTTEKANWESVKYGQHQLDAALRQERIRAMNQSAISFDAPEIQQNQRSSNTFTSNIYGGATAKFDRRKHGMTPVNGAKEALLAGTQPLEARRQKHAAEFAPIPREYDIAQPGRKAPVYAYQCPTQVALTTQRLQ
eukprot:EST43380.1 Hypothetical protein SS50377_17060 [Spironucleus salmonicida]